MATCLSALSVLSGQRMTRLGRGMLVGLWAGLSVASAQADVWAFVDDQGEIKTAPYPIDSRYQQVTSAGTSTTSGTNANIPASTSINTPPNSSTAAPVRTETRSLGRRRHESAQAWVRRLTASPTTHSLQPLMREAASASGIDPLLIKAMIAVESGFNPQAVSPKGALGLMQIMPDTADRFATAAEKQEPATQRLLNPRTNIFTGARVLADLARRFQRVDLIVAAWNAGEGAVSKYGGLPPFDETQQHVLQVLELYRGLLMHQMTPSPPHSTALTAPNTPR